MANNDKRIPKEEQKHFERCLFENDFFDVSAPDEEEQETSAEDSPQEEEAPAITEEDLAQAESRGYTQGLAEGKKQAAEDHTAELKAHASKLTEALNEIDASRAEITQDIKLKAMGLLEIITDTLLADAREKYPTDLLKNAVALISQLSDDQKDELKILVAPQTKAYMTETLLKTQKVAGIDESTLKEDASLDPGDCIIEWVDGGADLRLNTLKDDVIAALQGAAKSTPEPEKVDEEDVQAKTDEAEDIKLADTQNEEDLEAADGDNNEADEPDSK